VFDTVVIGGGVAGLTAGLFAARLGCSTMVLAPGIPGGQLGTIDRVEDFPGFPAGIAGYEFGPAIQEQAMDAGAEFSMAEAQRLQQDGSTWLVTTDDGELQTRTVIVATGSRPRELGVPGEERLRGRGISHCASCDGPLLAGKPAVVVGAGDSGLQEALTLATFASEVLVVHQSECPTAQQAYLRRVADSPKITLQGNTVVEEILGDELVTGVRIRSTVSGAASTHETPRVFVYVGLQPNTDLLRGVMPLAENGRVPVDLCMRTRVPGLLAAGDIRCDSSSQAITSAGDGATAAITARRYLDDGTWP
jgi:thioredoxin reductase (NADPH)